MNHISTPRRKCHDSTRMGTRLVVAGWVVRVRDANDRRIQRVQLTQAGQSLRDELEREMIELNQEIAIQLSNRADAFWATLAQIGETHRNIEPVAAATSEGRKRRATAG